jgi:hypothetical protein
MSKSEEELRAKNRERQRRWREKHKWLGEQRRLRNYGSSKAQLEVTHNAIPIWVDDPESGERMKVWVDGRTRIGKVVLSLWRQVHGLEPVTNNESSQGVEVEGF